MAFHCYNPFVTDFEGAPKDEQLPIPEDLDPATLQVVVDLWNSTLAGASAEIMQLYDSKTPARPDYSKLKGEELYSAVRELVSTDIDPAVCRLGECAVFRAMESFGKGLTLVVEKNKEV